VSGAPEKLKTIGGQYGIPADSLYSYDSFDKIAQNEAVQVIYIVLPNSTHKDFVLRARRRSTYCAKSPWQRHQPTRVR